MLAELSSHQLSEWLAYGRAYGLPPSRADGYREVLLALLANINRAPNSPARLPEDFALRSVLIEEVQKEDTEAVELEHEPFDVKAASRALAGLLGKKEG